MEDIKKNETETVKNEAPRPGTKAYVEAELAAAKAELEAMKAQQAKAAEAPVEDETPAVTEAPKEKMVKIRIPRTKADQEDVFVSVNLRTWIVKRGVEVEVPECVAEVIRHQEEALESIMLFDEANKKGN